MEDIRVIIAIRVSSEDQKERGFGHANQVRRLPELVAEQGWTIAQRPDGTPGIYDEGAASTSTEDDSDDGLGLSTRPVLEQLIRELPDVRPTYLVCRKLDRLHRNNLQWEYLQHKLLAAGVDGIVQFPALDGYPEVRRIGSPRERAWASMEATWASLEKAELKEKLMAARRERAARGLPNGGPTPYGYVRPVRGGPLVVDEAEAAVYLKMLAWAKEGHGFAWITNRLNKDGIRPRRSKKGWTATSVRKILENESQTGMIRTCFGGVNRWQRAADMPAIVSREEWLEVREIIDARSFNTGATNKRKRPLAGLLKCAACGGTLKGRRERRRRRDGTLRAYEYYICKVYDSGCQDGSSISERRAIRELHEQVSARLDATHEWVDVTGAGDDLGPIDDRISEVTSALGDAERKVRRAHTAWIDADDDLAEIALDELNKRRERARGLADELAQLKRERLVASQGPTEPVDVAELRALLDGWLDFPDDEKRAFLESLIEHAVLLPIGRERRLQVVWKREPHLAVAA